MVREADCILFLGSYRAKETPFDVDCGYCSGPDGCGFVYSRRKTAWGQIDGSDRGLQKTLIDGPLCIIRVSDLGFPVGSALWMAKTLMVDCRPFMSMGVAGQRLGYCKNSTLVVGLPVATTSKNPFVDVHHNYHVVNMGRMVDSIRKHYIISRQSGMDYRHLSLEKFLRVSETMGGAENVERMRNLVMGKKADEGSGKGGAS